MPLIGPRCPGRRRSSARGTQSASLLMTAPLAGERHEQLVTIDRTGPPPGGPCPPARRAASRGDRGGPPGGRLRPPAARAHARGRRGLAHGRRGGRPGPAARSPAARPPEPLDRLARRGGRGRARAAAGAARSDPPGRLLAAPGDARAGGEAGLLRRLLGRGDLAALPWPRGRVPLRSRPLAGLPQGQPEVRTRAAFFLHIPFPGPDTFAKLPWRERLLAGLLAHDRLGFQTARDLANFLACVRAMAPGIRVLREEAGSDGESGAATARLTRLVGEIRGRRCRLAAGAFPIGVDCAEISRRAARPEVGSRLAALRRELGGRRLVLGVDTL